MKRSPLLVRAIIFSVIVIAAIAVGYSILDRNNPLPVLRPLDLNPALVDESLRGKTRHRIGAFHLTDQRGRIITEKDLDEHRSIVLRSGKKRYHKIKVKK